MAQLCSCDKKIYCALVFFFRHTRRWSYLKIIPMWIIKYLIYCLILSLFLFIVYANFNTFKLNTTFTCHLFFWSNVTETVCLTHLWLKSRCLFACNVVRKLQKSTSWRSFSPSTSYSQGVNFCPFQFINKTHTKVHSS